MSEFLSYAVGFLVLLVGGYVIIRAWSKAYYRTRMEHLRGVMRETTSTDGEDKNG